MPLSKAIEAIKQASKDCADEHDKYRMRGAISAENFIESANAKECLAVIKHLIERVSSLTGCSSDLEDAACVLQRHIESEGE